MPLPRNAQPGSAWRITRRQLLHGSAMTLLATSLPTLLTHCASSDEANDPDQFPAGTRETRTLHFDLSLNQRQVQDLQLSALRSTSHKTALQAHTDASRQRFRRLSPVLAEIPDEQLTHYVESVDLPADALQLVTVMGMHVDTGEPVLCSMHIHIPHSTLTRLAQHLDDTGTASLWAAKRQAYNLRRAAAPLQEEMQDLHAFLTPFDTAVSLVFHHPEVMNLNPDLGAAILQAIQTLPCADSDSTCAPFISTLAFQIATKWPARTTPGGWATIVQQTYSDGTPVLDQQGNPVYRYDLDEEINATTAAVAQSILKAFIFDNPTFEGSNWHPTDGIASVSQEPAVLALTDTNLRVEAAHPVGSSLHGVKLVGLTVADQTKRVVKLEVKNHYIRYVSVYVQFFDAAGNALPVDPSQVDEDLNSSRAMFVKLVPSNVTILGIPLTGNNVLTTPMEFTVPADASTAKVLFGSLGMGGNAFCPEALPGAVMTLVVNIGIPAIFLVLGVGLTNSGLAMAVLNGSVQALLQILKSVLNGLTDENKEFNSDGIFGIGHSSSVLLFIVSMGKAAVEGLLQSSPRIATAIGGLIAAQSLIEAAPIVGAVIRVLAATATLATLDQTISEVLFNPALFDNTISLSMDTTVTIHPDPDNFRFPAEASKYQVTATYDKAVTRVATGTFEPNRVDPIAVTLTGVPSGGTVTIAVVLTTDADWIVGHGSADALENTVESASNIAITIAEVLIPLTATTRYRHDLKLAYQDGQHVWAPTAAPTATLANLCSGQDNALCSLTGITVHPRTGMAGYGFEAGGMAACTGAPAGIYHTIQNVFLGPDPDRAWKALGCGFATPVGIVYDFRSPADKRQFFLQPRLDGQGFDLRSVTLDNTTPFDLDQPLSWGRFTQALDALAVHPAGYVIGVNRQSHTMEILTLPDAAEDETVAPTAVPFAVFKSGPGTRAGLMNAPVAVAVSQGAVLVLEQGNRRVQAFDVSGHPVLLFQNQTSNLMPLRDEGAGVTYLDLGAEAQGYIYILSYVDNGLDVSDYRLDVYTPNGDFLSRTTGVAAARMAVDTFRNVYTLNYETIANAPHIEPSLSQWLPSTPGG